MNYFSANLKFLLRKFDVTQAQLALHLNRSQNSVSNWSNAQTSPDLDDLVGMYQFFGISLDALVFTDLQKGNLITEQHLKDFKRNGNQIRNPIGNRKAISKEYFGSDSIQDQVLNEPDPVVNWAIMGQFKQVHEKLDQLRVLGENILKKQG